MQTLDSGCLQGVSVGSRGTIKVSLWREMLTVQGTIKVLLWWEMLTVGEAVCWGEPGVSWGLSILSTLFCCKPKIALKKIKLLSFEKKH